MQRLSITFLFMLITVQVIAGYPQRVISLAPSITKSLYLLDSEDMLKGCTSFCILENPDDAQVVASAVQVNIEKAVLLKPDLVLTTPLTTPETIRTFEKLGIEVLNFPYPRSFDDICNSVLILGEKIGKEKPANQLVAEARQQLEIVKSKVPHVSKKPKIFIQIGANPLFTAVPNTFMQDFIEFSGCENIADDLKAGSITRETVLVRDPDVILVVLMGIAGKEEREKWEKFKNLSAVKGHNIFIMDQEKMCSPTPQLFVEALNEIIELIYNN